MFGIEEEERSIERKVTGIYKNFMFPSTRTHLPPFKHRVSSGFI
jgi:hypothetical protein